MSKKLTKYVIDKLLDEGADKAECKLTIKNDDELNVHNNEIDLFRTKKEITLKMTAIVDEKKGGVTVNKLDKKIINKKAKEVIDMAKSSKKDVYDISDKQKESTFESGPKKPDHDKMYERLDEFKNYVNKNYPKIKMEQSIVNYNNIDFFYRNSNGVFFKSDKNYYDFAAMFFSKDEEKTSSFNYDNVYTKNLDEKLVETATFDAVLSESVKHLNPESIHDKFQGDIILTPNVLRSFINFIVRYLEDYSLIKGNSIYQDKLNKKIASEKLSLSSKPLSDDIATNYFITSDGYKAENLDIIKDGVLKSFILSIYGANKTGFDRVNNSGGCFVVEPGDKNLDEIIKTVDKGIFLRRFSGGNPSDNGDFSGIAKNSFYIEDGKIKQPLKETMISGNLADLIKDIENVSKERVNFGTSIYPWIKSKNITISSK